MTRKPDLHRRVRRTVLCDWFGIQSHEAAVLFALFDGSPAAMKSQRIAELCYLAASSVPVAICALRKVMENEAIDRDDDGYRLTEIGTAEVKRALIMIGQTLSPEAAA